MINLSNCCSSSYTNFSNFVRSHKLETALIMTAIVCVILGALAAHNIHSFKEIPGGWRSGLIGGGITALALICMHQACTQDQSTPPMRPLASSPPSPMLPPLSAPVIPPAKVPAPLVAPVDAPPNLSQPAKPASTPILIRSRDHVADLFT